MKISNLPSTLLGSVGPRRLPPYIDQRRFVSLFFEAVLYTTVAVALTRAWGRSAMIFSIFLTAGALIARFNDLLDENRELVWGESAAKKGANVLTASSILFLFGGVFVVYFSFLEVIGVREAVSGFGAALDAASVGEKSQAIGALIERNLLILSSFVVLGFIYQSYGATLAICWTACAWTLALTIQLDARLEDTERPAWLALALTLGTVLPSAALKAFGYISGTLSAIFLSRGLLRYGLRGPKLRPVLGAVLLLAVAAICCLVVAAYLEVTLAQWAMAPNRFEASAYFAKCAAKSAQILSKLPLAPGSCFAPMITASWPSPG